MLCIILPNVTIIKPIAQSVPQNPPPPLAKLQKKTITAKEKDAETDARENSVQDEDTSSRRTSDPDDDPLNVPDFYYTPTLPRQTASTSSQGSSGITVQQAAQSLKPTKNAEKSQQDVTRTRMKTHLQVNSENMGSGGSTWKRKHPHTNLESENMSDIPPGIPGKMQGATRKQTSKYIREDFMASDAVNSLNNKSKKT
ncbi:hypothetical protein L9F63_010179 [Diploptera punctata]|uniref:Uncharacterized protein n=1 Tax=Diploptera punctata TaxID=6984 RepID=A0AAD8AHN9_DIPPU|nr:hypothetical protein L9F63_010179 [Diploptera punctata]